MKTLFYDKYTEEKLGEKIEGSEAKLGTIIHDSEGRLTKVVEEAFYNFTLKLKIEELSDQEKKR